MKRLFPIIFLFLAGISLAVPKLPKTTLLNLNGEIHDLAQPTSYALIFLGHECPISNAAIPALNELAKETEIPLLGITSDETLTRRAAKEHFQEYKVTFPILFDASGTIADSLKPTHVPEAFVFNAEKVLIYRGAINNAFVDLGRRRAEVENHYLRDALASLSKKELPEKKYVPPVGCLVETLPKGQSSSKITYTRDIAPIIFNRCVTCHRPGQAAPFSLTDYKSTAKRARQLLRVIDHKLMPPWMPKPGAQPKFVGERIIPSEEIKLLEEWVAAGRPEGNPEDLPPLPKFSTDWELGPPDLILRMTVPFKVYADGPDILQNFVIPVDIPEDKLVRAIEFRPGNKRVVHHSVLFLDDSGAARKLDAETPEPGYSNFGSAGFLPSGALGGWSVGNTARELPAGMGRYLKKGSDLVMQIHYHPTGKEEIDQSEVAVYFIDRPVAEVLAEPAKLISSFWLSDYMLEIPAGEKAYPSHASYTLPKDIIMVGLVPHMHLLGRSIRATATLPDGTVKPLVKIPDWNYNWQDELYYREPFPLPAGTKLDVHATFDNSASNPSNPADPPQKITWGDGTLDEMMFCFFLFTAEKTEDIIFTTLHNLGHDLKLPRLNSETKTP